MFTASRPAQQQAFLDREPALARLQRAVERLAAGAPEWLAIIGPRKVGKTSLVLEASHRYSRPRTARPASSTRSAW